jgi:hypothetical protein
MRRTPADAEVNGWLDALPSLGRSAVATSFLGSPEFRSAVVRTFYGVPSLGVLPLDPFRVNLLHRTISLGSGELAGWVNSAQDLRTIEAGFLGSQEFFVNG